MYVAGGARGLHHHRSHGQGAQEQAGAVQPVHTAGADQSHTECR